MSSQPQPPFRRPAPRKGPNPFNFSAPLKPVTGPPPDDHAGTKSIACLIGAFVVGALGRPKVHDEFTQSVGYVIGESLIPLILLIFAAHFGYRAVRGKRQSDSRLQRALGYVGGILSGLSVLLGTAVIVLISFRGPSLPPRAGTAVAPTEIVNGEYGFRLKAPNNRWSVAGAEAASRVKWAAGAAAIATCGQKGTPLTVALVFVSPHHGPEWLSAELSKRNAACLTSILPSGATNRSEPSSRPTNDVPGHAAIRTSMRATVDGRQWEYRVVAFEVAGQNPLDFVLFTINSADSSLDLAEARPDRRTDEFLSGFSLLDEKSAAETTRGGTSATDSAELDKLLNQLRQSDKSLVPLGRQ